MSSIVPNPEAFQKFAAAPDGGPVVMINLLRFKVAGSGQVSGREAYQRYADSATQMILQHGGHVVWMGRPEQILIGDAARDQWDLVALVPPRSNWGSNSRYH